MKNGTPNNLHLYLHNFIKNKSLFHYLEAGQVIKPMGKILAVDSSMFGTYVTPK